MGSRKNVSASSAAALFALVIFGVFSSNAVDGKENCTSKTNTSCEDCSYPSSSCYWCENNKKCDNFVLKKGKEQNNCGGSDMYYKQCFVSGKLLIIIVPCVVVGVLIILGCLVYCCCCRRCGRRKDKFEEEDRKLKKERTQRKKTNQQRKAEREARSEKIRMKYGLKNAASEES